MFGAVLQNADNFDQFAGATITNRDLVLCNLAEANLQKTVFTSTDLRGSAFDQANLGGANLLTANLDFVDWRGAMIDDATRLAPKTKLIWELT